MQADEDNRIRDPFRWRSTALFVSFVIVVLLFLRQVAAAGGVALGWGLHAGNLLLMMEIGRSLTRQKAPSRIKTLAALSSTGRLLLLAMALSAIAVFLNHAVLFGTFGGLLIGQVNLHAPRLGDRREERG
jgi:hypothetical protein